MTGLVFYRQNKRQRKAVSAQHSENTRQEIISGLTADPAHISPKYLYDELGSRLFAAITALPEYYPTRTEA
ncbi:MAG: L-histidine N(alpha)-methyltransferase, partial [Pusillimonas sp.]|nr:L-histidine N(alpha)-methyltransferase [Pusillimonas sp.]